MHYAISGFRSTWGDNGLLLLWFIDCTTFEIVEVRVSSDFRVFFVSLADNLSRRAPRS